LKGWYRNDILYGGAGDDVLDGGQGSNELYGGDVLRVHEDAKNNLFVGGKGNDTMYGSKHADTYLFNLGDGQDTIVEAGSYHGAVDVLKFGEDLSPEQLWFQRRDNHLAILVAGTEDRVTVNDWYSGSRHRIEIMQASNGLALTESRVQNLVNAMAAFAVPAGADFNLLPDQRAQLDMVIAANWQ